MQLRFHTQTAGSTLTAKQPDNNIVRVAIQALAAVLGGTQSLHCNGRDEALALPTEESARIALRTQQIIASETGVANTVDPCGGSWEIEAKTSAIEQGARALIAQIDAMGGTLRAIEHGWIQRQIQDAAYAAQQRVDRGESVIVGVNQYGGAGASRPDAGGLKPAPPSAAIELLTIDPEVERRQVAAVRDVRRTRDASACAAALEAVSATARGSDNLVPPIIAAVEAHATLGEISDAMRAVFGEHQEIHA
jgi:methylmalonyl-CoA mutase N-terminal domain/subunit